MNITIVSASPKSKLSTSLYFSRVLKAFLLGHNVKIIKLKSVKDYNELLLRLPSTDALVFAFPIYVDAIPSTVLDYLQMLEKEIALKSYLFKVYGVNVCGFYEGQQCNLCLNMLSNWCKRTNLEWCGGLGIGAGEMLSILRLSIPIGILITLIELIVHGVSLHLSSNFSFANLFQGFFPLNFIIQTLVYLGFSLGMFVNLFRMRNYISRKKTHKDIFTTVWFCPRFLFVVFASIYWVLRALILHGVPFWKLFNKPTK